MSNKPLGWKGWASALIVGCIVIVALELVIFA